MAYRITVGHST